MASLAPREGSVAPQALLGGKGQGQSGGVPGRDLSPLIPPHVPTLTQQQIEGPSSHPAGAEWGHQAAEIGLPVSLQLLCHCPVGVKGWQLKSQPGLPLSPGPKTPPGSLIPIHRLQRQQLGLQRQLERQLHGRFREFRHHRQRGGLWLLCLGPGPGRAHSQVEQRRGQL